MLSVSKFLSIYFLASILSFAEPSKEETINFLQEKLNVKVNIDHGEYEKYIERQSFIDNGNCNFTIKIVNDGIEKINDIRKAVYGASKSEIIFNAKDLDPTKVYFDKGNSSASAVTIDSLKNKKNITYKKYFYEPKNKKVYCKKDDWYSLKILNSKECVITWYDNEVMIPLLLSPYDNNRPRVIKAMKHLIKSCGGKGELF